MAELIHNPEDGINAFVYSAGVPTEARGTMKRLWAPWRMTYIRQIKEQGCFLCRMFGESEDRKNLLLLRGRTCAVVMNRYPYNNGHLMVCPYRHVDDLAKLTGEERAETMDLVIRSVDVLRTAMNPDGFNVGINLGRTAGAGLDEHVHTHVVPRWNGDTNYMPVLADVKVIPQSLEDLWDQLHPRLSSRG
jgi:ATP adenylyltransferase